MELPGEIVLSACRGFEKVAVDIDPKRGVLGVVRDGAPGVGQAVIFVFLPPTDVFFLSDYIYS